MVVIDALRYGVGERLDSNRADRPRGAQGELHVARLTLNPSFPSLRPGAFAPYTAACMAADFVAQYQGTGR